MSNTANTLPADFTPGDHDVVIGKGKKFYFHAGNQWLRTVVAERITEYSQAMTKADKSNIISSVVDYVRANGQFVKIDNNGTWVFAEPLLCREKCSQTFRDNLAQTYRSSNVAKRNKRRQEQQEKTNFAIANMVLYPPQPKRVRTSYDSYAPMKTPSSPSSFNMEPLQVPSSPNSCATWFDWDMPLFADGISKDVTPAIDLEPISIQSSFQSEQQQQSVTANDFDGLFFDLSGPTNNIVDEFEPLPALCGSVKPLKAGSMMPTIVDQSAPFRRGNELRRRSTAAFAA